MSIDSRVSIPNSIRKTIQNIKEIAGNHSDEEIYAMLKECSMDPNETAQKLLLQDTFHEVRRKRDKRKENLNSRESVDSRRRSSIQGRGSRVGRGSYSSCYMSNDAGNGRNANVRKENGVHQSKEKSAVSSSLPNFDEAKSKAGTLTSRSVAVIANGPDNVAYKNSSHRPASELQSESGGNTPEKILAVGVNKSGAVPPSPVDGQNTSLFGISITIGQLIPNSDQFLVPSTSVSGISSSSSDPVLVQSLDTWATSAERIIKCEVGSQWTAVESDVAEVDESVASQDFANLSEMKKVVSCNMSSYEFPLSTSEKVAAETGSSFMHGKRPNECQGVEKELPSEPLQHSTAQSDFSSRPSSNYVSQAEQLIGSQKVVGPGKEWKSQSITPNHVLPSGTAGTSEIVVRVTVEGSAWSETTSSPCNSDEAPIQLKKKLEELHFSDNQHVIIPNHIHVPEAERNGLSFGSFDASFGVCTNYIEGPDGDKNSTGLSESSQGIEETDEEPSLSNQKASPAAQERSYPDHPEAENLLPVEADRSSNEVFEHDQSNQNSVFPPEGPQDLVVHTAPNYSSFGLMPPVLGTQLAPFDGLEPQPSDGSQLSSLVVQQPFDPSTSYYNHFYQPGADVDGRFSPFLVPGAVNKNNGNTAMLSVQSGRSHESGNSPVLSTAGPTALMSQTAGVMQSTVPMNQQPVPIFRQPAGVISHYPPNYIPYSHYYSPFLVPPPTIHHFLSNTAFPQQPPGGNLYLSPPATAATGVKFSLPQYKSGTNTGNSTLGMPTSFLPYSSFPSGYNIKTTAITGYSTGNEELTTSQYKENNACVNVQQSEGSAIWIPAFSRDISGLQAGSLYNFPPHGQHVTFGPTQAGQSAIAGNYHPVSPVVPATVHPLLRQSQTIPAALEMVGPPPSTYQQPQGTQINWTNHY